MGHSTSNGNSALSLNGSSACAGQMDGAASLDATSNFIQIPSSSLNGWTQQTVSVWINAQTNMQTFARLSEKGANNEWTLSFLNQALTLENLGTNSVAITTSKAVADNTWHKIDATIDNNTKAIAIYVDGALNVAGTSASSASNTTNSIYLGQYGGGYYYRGPIDEVGSPTRCARPPGSPPSTPTKARPPRSFPKARSRTRGRSLSRAARSRPAAKVGPLSNTNGTFPGCSSAAMSQVHALVC
jgi:hypothetical protein